MRPTERSAPPQTSVATRGDESPGQRIAISQHMRVRADDRRSLIDALRDELAFLRGFLRRPNEVGSVIPSSSVLEQDLIAQGHLRAARCVVELGPGTGGTTRAFLRAMPAESRLLAIELSPVFHARLTTTVDDPRLIAQFGSAEEIEEFLAAWRLPAPDAIVSGIPFSTMPAPVADRIAVAIARTLAPGGRFVAYQFRAHVDRHVSPHLGSAVRHWQWINIPPVRVFTWTKR